MTQLHRGVPPARQRPHGDGTIDWSIRAASYPVKEGRMVPGLSPYRISVEREVGLSSRIVIPSYGFAPRRLFVKEG